MATLVLLNMPHFKNQGTSSKSFIFLYGIDLQVFEDSQLQLALRAFQVPTEQSRVSSCGSSSASFEIYQPDGTPELYYLLSKPCASQAVRESESFSRTVFYPSAFDFINLLDSFDNF